MSEKKSSVGEFRRVAGTDNEYECVTGHVKKFILFGEWKETVYRGTVDEIQEQIAFLHEEIERLERGFGLYPCGDYAVAKSFRQREADALQKALDGIVGPS